MRRLLPPVVFALFASAYLLPSVLSGGTSQGLPLAHNVQGFLFVQGPLAPGEEPETPFAGTVFVPGVRASLENVDTGARTSSVRTDLSGRFAFTGQPSGRYRVCWSGRGLGRGCSKTFSLVDHVHLGPLPITVPRGARLTTIFGRVQFADRSLPRALDPVAGVNSYAVVTALDRAGRPLVPQAYVNNSGDFVIPGLRSGQAIVLETTIEGANRRTKLALARSGKRFPRVEITLPNTPPESDGIVAQAASGTQWTARPGEEVALTVRGTDPDGDPLSFRWIPASGTEQVSVEGNHASFRLPKALGDYEFAVLVSDAKGGYTKDTITLTTGKVHFAGTVKSTDAGVLPAAEVDVNGARTVTDEGGHFELLVDESPRYMLNIRHPGYASVSHIYDVGRTGEVWTLTRASLVTADPKVAIEASNERIRSDCPRAPRSARECPPGITIRIPAGALVDENGKPPDGPVQVALATADLAASDALPGDSEAASDAGVQRPFVSMGAGFVEITRQGVRYNLAPEAEAELVIPIAHATTGAPDRIQLFGYDEQTGRWVQEGLAVREGNAFVARVQHLSTFSSGIYTSGPSCLRIESTLMPEKFDLKFTWSFFLIGPSSQQSLVRVIEDRLDITDNGRQRFHVIPNLPLNTSVQVTAFVAGTRNAIQLLAPGPTPGVPVSQTTLTVNTGATPQNPPAPNPPAWPYSACSSKVELSPFPLGASNPNPLLNTFFYGLSAFQAVNLNEVDTLTSQAVEQTTVKYYETIDPGNKRLTLDEFKEENKFASGGVIGAQYANSGDLGFGRDMQCRRAPSGDVACYVTNYGDRFTDDVTDAIDAKANAVNPGTRAPVATVAMEYSQIEAASGSPGTTSRIVKFYVYNGAGDREDFANLDGFGARPVPALCMVCHGGKFPLPQTTPGQPTFTQANPGSADLDARFIPFDLRSFTLPAANVPGVGFFDFKSQQQAAFKALNQIVAATGVPAEAQQVIEKMYTPNGGQPGSSPTQIESFVTSGWLGGTPRFAPPCRLIFNEMRAVQDEIDQLQAQLRRAPPGEKQLLVGEIRVAQAALAQLANRFAACVAANPVPTLEEELYDKVVAASCRTCHLSLAPRTPGPSRSWERAQDFRSNPSFLQRLVCRNHVMPHAIATHNRFWFSANPSQPRLLHQFFNNGLVAPETCIQP